MNNLTKMEISTVSSYSCPEIGAIHHYIKHHLKSIIHTNSIALSEPLLFGLGCGLSFNFEENNKGVIHISTVNDQHIKDLLAHLNIKVWYKTEPDPNRFLSYLGDLLLQSGPVVTFNKNSSNLFYHYYPVLILGCNSEKTLFELYDFYSNQQKSINTEELIEACNFSNINAPFHNFWFETALAEQIFPLENSIKWALVKNVQSMLYAPGNTRGVAALSLFSVFLQNMHNAYSGDNFFSTVSYIKSALKQNEHSSIANRELFLDFLIQAMEVLKINELSVVADAFKKSHLQWEHLYNALEMIEDNNVSSITNLLEKASKHCDEIIEIEGKALNELEKILLR